MTMQGFWRNNRVENRRATLNQYGQVNNVWLIAPEGMPVLGGFGNPAGSFASFTDLKPHLRSRDVIYLFGVLREQVVCPDDVYDVLVLGGANTPRQATDSGEPTGGGATWMAPLSPTATTPLIEVVRQGWTFDNIAFNPVTNSAAVRLTTTGGLDEAGQAAFTNCLFTGGGTGQIGIEDNGGSGMVQIINNVFRNLSGTAILGLNTANAVPSFWQIMDNLFGINTNDVKMSLSNSRIEWNTFRTVGSGATNKVVSTVALSGQGALNSVSHNVFANTAAQIANASGYNGAADDNWSDNYCTDAVDYGVPA